MQRCEQWRWHQKKPHDDYRAPKKEVFFFVNKKKQKNFIL